MTEHLSAVVAILVKNEADRIAACLDALAAQRDDHNRPIPARTYSAVLVLNNCTDATADIVQSIRGQPPYRVSVIERELPPEMAHAEG